MKKMPTREISSRDVFLPHAVNYGKSIDTQTIIFAWHLVAYFLLVSHEGQAMTFFSETKKKFYIVNKIAFFFYHFLLY